MLDHQQTNCGLQDEILSCCPALNRPLHDPYYNAKCAIISVSKFRSHRVDPLFQMLQVRNSLPNVAKEFHSTKHQ